MFFGDAAVSEDYIFINFRYNITAGGETDKVSRTSSNDICHIDGGRNKRGWPSGHPFLILPCWFQLLVRL